MNNLRGYAAIGILLLCGPFWALAQNSTGSNTTASGAVPGLCCPGTPGAIPLYKTSTSFANSVIFQSGSQVGIDTTAPASTLDVNGTINAATSFNLGGDTFAFGSWGNRNAFLGFAGTPATTGLENTASGVQALSNNTTGGDNTANGFQALANNNTGLQNAAFGSYALPRNTTGGGNTAVGYQALYSNSTGGYNTANGIQALYFNQTGGNNTASGLQTLYFNTTGSDNTASGYLAGSTADYSWITGADNTFLGAGTSMSTGTLNFATAIGAGAVVGESNALVLGGTGTFGVVVGIGTSTPAYRLTLFRGGGAAMADGWSTWSSRRWKTHIQPLRGSLAKVEQLRGVSYDLKANGKREIGVIAEEVGTVVPEVVTWAKNGKDADGVDYSRLTALLIEAIKEQQAQIKAQESQIAAQQAESKLQRAQIARLTSQIQAIQAWPNTNRRTDAEVRTMKAEVPIVHQ